MSDTIQETMERLERFTAEREWAQYHSPRNLVVALCAEAGELLETMLWQNEAEYEKYLGTPAGHAEVCEELADILIYALLLAGRLRTHPLAIVEAKVRKNELRYPAAEVRGRRAKGGPPESAP